MNSNIAILSTVVSNELYQISSQLFPNNIKKYVIDGTNGMYTIDSICYMMEKLKNKGVDWLIMADEDVLFEDTNLVFDIIRKMELENYTVCGVRDGGVIVHRDFSPYVINTFFSIINFKEIESIWNKKEVLKNQYYKENEFEDDLSSLKNNFIVSSLYEPYYCFYFWLRRNNKQFLFLDANYPFADDQYTNAVYFEGKKLLYHTWFARSYGINKKHTDRINKILELQQFENKTVPKAIVLKHSTFFLIKRIRKLRHRIIMRMKIIFKTIQLNR